MKPGGFIDVDKLQSETSLQEAAAKCGVSLDVRGDGTEVRIDCPFNCAGDHAGRKEVAINTENPQKVFQCHAYQCQFRGNLLTLMHGMLTGQKPSGGRLKGEEFQRVKTVLASKEAATPANAKAEMPKESAATPPPGCGPDAPGREWMSRFSNAASGRVWLPAPADDTPTGVRGAGSVAGRLGRDRQG